MAVNAANASTVVPLEARLGGKAKVWPVDMQIPRLPVAYIGEAQDLVPCTDPADGTGALLRRHEGGADLDIFSTGAALESH